MVKKKMAKSKLTAKLGSSGIAKELKIETKKSEKKLGHYSFIIGVVLAVISGIFVPLTSIWARGIVVALLILGLIVGLLNIKLKETQGFLIASIALLLTGFVDYSLFIPGSLGEILQATLVYIRNFVAPAAIIVALKSMKTLAED